MLRHTHSPFALKKRGKLKKTYSKIEAIKIVCESAKTYEKYLKGKNLLFLYRDRNTNNIDYFETLFLSNQFQHLTGIEMIDSKGKKVNSANLFFDKCIKNKLRESEIQFRKDGTTPLKLKALAAICDISNHSKMTGVYNGIGVVIEIDRVVGTISFCLGFKRKGKYYYPSSCLLEDIRVITNNTSQILAILAKPANDKDAKYIDVRYVAKGIKLDKLNIPQYIPI